MAPQAKGTALGRQKRQVVGIGASDPAQSTEELSGTRKSMRLQKRLSVSGTVSYITPPGLLAQPKSIKRKPSREPEPDGDEVVAGYPIKERQITSQRFELSQEALHLGAEGRSDEPEGVDTSEQTQQIPLSEEDLQSLYKEVMDFAAKGGPSLKRTRSQSSFIMTETDATRSQLSSNTNAHYRHKCLKAFKIHLHARPPDNVKAAVNSIVYAEISKQRLAELSVIVHRLNSQCLTQVLAQSGEDDFIRPLSVALEALCVNNLRLHAKVDWRQELKPELQQHSLFSWDIGTEGHKPAPADVSAPQPKRQRQAAARYESPEAAEIKPSVPSVLSVPWGYGDLPPPAPIAVEKGRVPVHIKTPRPDISIGIDLEAVISALSSKPLDRDTATAFIDWLQNEMKQQKPNGALEPMLILMPALRTIGLVFPFAVVEAKAYSTGKQLFEVENQAAVAGACALKIQLGLDRLVKEVTSSSDALLNSLNIQPGPPLFFSITTQGPVHEFWYHWTSEEGGRCSFVSALLDSYNVLVPERAEKLVLMLNNVCSWGTGSFMKSVVERLEKVLEKALKNTNT